MRRLSFLVLGLAVAALDLACGGDATSPLTATCTPGASQACTCGGGGAGVEVCSAVGTFLPCLCAEGDAGASHHDAIAPLPDAHFTDDGPCLCDDPPAPVCTTATTLVVSSPGGTCSLGHCTYPQQEIVCSEGCSNGACTGSDACAGVTCNTPPAPVCADANDLQTYAATGTCAGGICTYASATSGCPDGCSDGACVGDPCVGIVCDSPPSPVCSDTQTLETYASTGTCSEGTCSYAPTDTTCTSGCEDGACEGDPCEGITCDDPPPAVCASTTVLTSYSATGTCSDGSCTYDPVTTTCTTTVANATGACSDGECTFNCNTGYVASGSSCVVGWTAETSGTADLLAGVWGTGSGNIYIVGDDELAGTGNIVLHGTGTGTWTSQTVSETSYSFDNIWGASATDIFIASSNDDLVSTGNGDWTLPANAEASVAIWGSSSVDVYGVNATTISHTTGAGAWTVETGCAVTNLEDVGGISSTSVYAVGDSGVICFSAGTGTWANQTSGSTQNLYGVWGSGANVYIVGAAGTILYSTGNGTWTAQTSGTTDDLYAVWGSGPGNIYAVSDAGGILHSTGNGVWTAETSGTTNALYDVWGSSGGDVYVVGDNGTILHKG